MNRLITVTAALITLLTCIVVFSQEPKLVLPVGHGYFLDKVAISGSGERTITMSEFDGAVLWDNRSKRILKKFPVKSDEEKFKSAALSFTGDYVLIGTNKEFRISRLDEENYFQPGLIDIQKAALGNSSNIMATMKSTRLLVWDLETKTKKIELNTGQVHTDFIFSQDDEKIISWLSGMRSEIRLWNIKTGKQISQFSVPKKITRLLINNEGSRIILETDDQNVQIYNASNAALLATIPFATLEESPFNQNNSKLLVNSKDKLSWWNLADGKFINEIKFPYYSVYNKSFFTGKEKDKLCIINSTSITIWNIHTLKQEAEISNTKNAFAESVSVHHGKSLAAITFYENNKALLLELNPQLKLSTLKGSSGPVLEVSLVGKKNQLLVSTLQNTSAWHPETGKQVVSLENAEDLYAYSVSPDDKYLAGITGQKNQKIRLWSLGTGKRLGIFQGDLDSGKQSHILDGLSFNKRGTEMVAGDEEGNLHFWNFPKGRKLLTKKLHSSSINAVDFNPSDSLLATGGHLSELKIWNANDLKLIKDIRLFPNVTVDKLKFSPDGNWLVASFFPRDFLLIINPNKDYSMNYIEFPGSIVDFKFSTIDNSLLIATHKVVYSLDKWYHKKIVFEADSNKRISSAVWTTDHKSIVVVYDDNAIELRTAAGKLIYTFYNFNSADYFSKIPSGYYQSSTNAAKLLHYVTKDLKVISFEQLDLKYNRPDKVLEAIGNTDTALIKSYRKAWEKRIKKLGIDTMAFRDGYSVPEADFVNRDAVEYEQKTGTLQLHIKGMDSTYKLDRFNIWVNESPLFGQRGISIRKKNSNSIDTTITIKLSQGENRIVTSITNVNGTESYRMPLYVNYTPAVKQKESLRFIGIGIDQFADSKYNLKYSAKDIRDLSKKLKEKYKENIVIDTLFNENVTTENVKALKQKLQHTTVNDKVIVSYSGHGLLSKEYDYYLSTYNINFEKPEQNGLPYDELENLLDSIPARKKLMLIDACHSGEVDKDELTRIDSINKTSEVKGLKPVAYKKEGQLGLKNSFELMQSLFVNVGKSTGATIISAAAGTQFALERNDLKNGVFTYSILEAMQKYPTIKISELKKIVGERVEQLTNGLQKPTSRNENIAVDWSLW